jgi:hypothetical protein
MSHSNEGGGHRGDLEHERRRRQPPPPGGPAEGVARQGRHAEGEQPEAAQKASELA